MIEMKSVIEIYRLCRFTEAGVAGGGGDALTWSGKAFEAFGMREVNWHLKKWFIIKYSCKDDNIQEER